MAIAFSPRIIPNSSLTREITMLTTVSEPIITWEKLPDDFSLPDDPVGNINQSLLAAALTEILHLHCAAHQARLAVKTPG